MGFVEHRAVKQLIDELDKAAVLDMIAIRVAIQYGEGETVTDITRSVTSVLRSYGLGPGEIIQFVQDNLDKNIEKYDGYGPEGFEQNTGLFHMSVGLEKNAESKIVRTVAADFSTVTGETQDFDVPLKVTVTEI